VDPKGHRQHLRRLAVFAVPGPIMRTPTLSIELETMVFALRDAEALVAGKLPPRSVIARTNVH
jgi:hypothetical protein